MAEQGARTRPGDPRENLRSQLDVSELLAIERAATQVVQPVARLWHDLVSATDTMVTPRSLDSALRDTLATMSRLLSVNSLAILLANEAGDELVARAAIGLGEELSVGMGIQRGEGMSGQVLETHAPLVVGDLSKIHVVNPVLRDSGLRSVVAVPMMSGEAAIGVMWAASYEQDRFTIADAELLQVVADRLSAALDRLRIFEREREARWEAERLADRIARIQRATAELAATQSSAAAAEALVRVAGARPDAWRGVWVRRDDRLELVAASGAPPDGWPETFPFDFGTPLGAAVAGRQAAYGAGDAEDAAGSWGILPIITSAGVAGALAVVSRRPDPFTTDERLLLSLVVGQAAQAFERSHLAEAERQAAERATFLARAAQALAEADTLASTLERLGSLAVATIGEICLVDVVSEDGSLARMVAMHRDPRVQPLVERLKSEFPPDPRGSHPAVRAIESGETAWSEEMSEEFLRATTVSEEHLALVTALGFRSYLTVPLVASARVVGSVTCVSTSRRFGRDDIAFAEELARHVAAVVDNARRYESAFRTSQILQSSLLPSSLPKVPGVTVETRYLTANRGLEVGGDFYDVLALSAGRVLFVVGDVAGHDRGAAAQMGQLRSAARALAGPTPSPASLIDALRAAWSMLGFERIATAVVGLLDPATGELTVASAGHYPPLLLTGSEATFLPLVPAPPLGMDAEAPAEWTGRLREGDVLLGYTDGAVDERTVGSEESMANLARVAAAGDLTPVSVCQRVAAAIAQERGDDVALLALAVERR